jgi:AcrR family transcriptional regulator
MAPRTVNIAAHSARRDEFVDAGMRLIQSRGYERFSIEDLLAEVGASKGAFYHYFDSKQALLEAIVERLVTTALSITAEVVDDPRLSALDKLHRFFAAIAAFKNARREFMFQLLEIWFSDDNAIVREKLRHEQIRLVAPQIAQIIRQGMGEGTFALADPDSMARVVLALILDTGDDAGELFLKRQAGEVELDAVRRLFNTYQAVLERILGLAAGTLHLIDDDIIHTWFS